MKYFLIAICIVCTVNGDTLRLSKVPGMKFSMGSLDETNISNYLLELLGLKVNPKLPSVIVEDPFGYANVLMILEDVGSLDCLPSSVVHKIKESVDWSEIENSLKVALNETRGKKTVFYESPQKPQKGQEGELKKTLVSQQKELEEIRTKISGVSNSKTVVWIKTIKSQDLTKQYCSIIQDFMKEASDKISIGLISKDAVLTHRKRTLLQTDAEPVATKGKIVFETSRDFPVIFTIVAVVVLIFFLSVLVISYGVAKMDPGRDSIIYRMTSQRMKKEQ